MYEQARLQPPSLLQVLRWLGQLAEALAALEAQDDLYALGVVACRLLTGEYPEMGAPLRDEQGRWYLEAVIVPRALLGGPQVEPFLRDMTLSLLSVEREQRGTAAQWARALEHEEAPPKEAPGPLTEERSGARGAVERFRYRARTWGGWPWLTLAATCPSRGGAGGASELPCIPGR